MPTLDELRAFLTQRQVPYTERPVQYGTQLACKSGELFTHYHKRGKIVPGGRTTALTQEVVGWAESGFTPAPVSEGDNNNGGGQGLHSSVFVVYGHDTVARENLELLLHRMDLEPIVLANL